MPTIREWLAHTKKLLGAAEAILATTEIERSEHDAADIRVMGLTLLARTYSNLKGIILLIEARRVVEARVLARCCFENAFWVAALVKDGEFVRAMLHDEIKHRTKRGEFILEKQLKLEAEVEEKMREWLKAHHPLATADALNQRASRLWAILTRHRGFQARPAHHKMQTLYLRREEDHGLPRRIAPAYQSYLLALAELGLHRRGPIGNARTLEGG